MTGLKVGGLVLNPPIKNCLFFVFFSFRLGSLRSKSTIPHSRHGEDAEGTGENCQVTTSTHHQFYKFKNNKQMTHLYIIHL